MKRIRNSCGNADEQNVKRKKNLVKQLKTGDNAQKQGSLTIIIIDGCDSKYRGRITVLYCSWSFLENRKLRVLAHALNRTVIKCQSTEIDKKNIPLS